MLCAQESDLQSCSNDGTLELLGAASPLLGHILLKTLLVLPEDRFWLRNRVVESRLMGLGTMVCSSVVSGIGGQMQTKADIWYYVPDQSTTIT